MPSPGSLPRRAPCAALSIVVLALAACTSFVPVVEEPLRVKTVDDLTPAALDFRVGQTTLDEARSRLGARGLTGVVDDALAGASGPTVSVLAADYQSRVFVFRDGRFVQSLALPTHGLPPYGLALRLAADGASRALLVLYRDPLDRVAEPPTMLVFHLRDVAVEPGAGFVFELSARATLETLAARHGGLSQPLLVGNDLTDGVMLVARDREGALWDTSYLIHADAGKIGLDPRPMTEALRCSCVQRYAAGAPQH